MYEEFEVAALGLETIDKLAQQVRQKLDSLYAEEEEAARDKVAHDIQSAVIDLKTRFETLDTPISVNGDGDGDGPSWRDSASLLCTSPLSVKNGSSSLDATPIVERKELLSTSSSYRSLGTSIDTVTILITESSK